MGKRTTGRRLAMQALYSAEISNIDALKALENITAEEKFISETLDFAQHLAEEVWKRKDEIDAIIKQYAIDWSLDRIGRVDRAVLRLAIAELILKETPNSVIINEAVELAKKYSSQEAAKFINGILGTYVRAS